MDKRRYDYLQDFVASTKAKVIIEIGTWKAHNAIKMIKESLKSNSPTDVYYYGFDLFELMDQKTFEYELSKWPPRMGVVEGLIKQHGINCELIRGNTNETLPKFVARFDKKADLIYIDGGHSIDTIRSDWENLSTIISEKTVVIFDDYYVMKDGSVPEKGCSSIIESLDSSKWSVQILPNFDEFDDKSIYFVEVRRAN